MKTRFLILVALAFLGVTAHAQEEEEAFELPFRPSFSLEIGTGFAPIHTLVNRSGLAWDDVLADKGLDPDTEGSWCPAFSLSAVWHTALRWEFALTGGVSWCNYRVTQYGIFGTDPQGRPRYDLDDPRESYRINSETAYALFFQVRRFWNPTQKVKLYSAVGFGFYTDKKPSTDRGRLTPVPSLTPIAVRFGTRPLKFFLEHTYSPAATAWQLGLGWTF